MRFKLVEELQTESDTDKLDRLWREAVEISSKLFPDGFIELINAISVQLSSRASENGSFNVKNGKIYICISNGRIKDPDDDVLSTLLHEIAHAFVFFFGILTVGKSRIEKNHGPLWEKTAKLLGEACDGRNIHPEDVTHSSDGGMLNYINNAKYRVFCSSCGKDIVRFHRMTQKRKEAIGNLILYRRCADCGGKITIEELR